MIEFIPVVLRMEAGMLDLDLLRSFVSVFDDGGFTRAGERVHRTHSTVSQQIRRLEATFGRPLLERNGKRVIPTAEGERLLSYARRLLTLAQEARDVVAQPSPDGVVRLGIPEDFGAYRLTRLLSKFARSRPSLRLDVRSELSVKLAADLERGELDLALLKREAGGNGGLGVWPERLHWVTSRSHPVDARRAPVPLPVFPHGCLHSQPGDPRAGSLRTRLAHRLYQPQFCEHPGRGLGRPRHEHSP